LEERVFIVGLGVVSVSSIITALTQQGRASGERGQWLLEGWVSREDIGGGDADSAGKHRNRRTVGPHIPIEATFGKRTKNAPSPTMM